MQHKCRRFVCRRVTCAGRAWLSSAYSTVLSHDPSPCSQSTKAAPALPLAAGHKWHLFLSHIWGTGQDQCATIKRQLCLLLPHASIFLDVDDLEDIGKLEEYVGASAVIMIFVSEGYFKSMNCLREAACTIERNKPIALVHDPVRGGAAMDKIKANECPAEMLSPIFDGRDVIEWHRIKDFQIISLKLLAHQLLLGCPCDKGLPHKFFGHPTNSLAIFLPGEVSRSRLAFSAPVLIYTSANNPGASRTVALLQEGTVGLRWTDVTPFTPLQFGSEPRVEMTAKESAGRLVGKVVSALAKNLFASVAGPSASGAVSKDTRTRTPNLNPSTDLNPNPNPDRDPTP